MQKFIARPHRQ